MRRFSRRVLPVALVLSMVGLAIASSSKTTTKIDSAKLQPVAGHTGIDKVPSTCSGSAVFQQVTVVSGGKTFPTVNTLSISIKGLLNRGYPDGALVFAVVNGKVVRNKKTGGNPVFANLQNGTAKIFVDSSMFQKSNITPQDVASGKQCIVGCFDSNNNQVAVLNGIFGPTKTTTK